MQYSMRYFYVGSEIQSHRATPFTLVRFSILIHHHIYESFISYQYPSWSWSLLFWWWSRSLLSVLSQWIFYRYLPIGVRSVVEIAEKLKFLKRTWNHCKTKPRDRTSSMLSWRWFIRKEAIVVELPFLKCKQSFHVHICMFGIVHKVFKRRMQVITGTRIVCLVVYLDWYLLSKCLFDFFFNHFFDKILTKNIKNQTKFCKIQKHSVICRRCVGGRPGEGIALSGTGLKKKQARKKLEETVHYKCIRNC